MDYIAGAWSATTVELPRWNRNPNNDQPIQPQKATTDADLERALQTAWELHQSRQWANTPIAERIAYLHQMADWLEQRVPEIAAIEAFSTGITLNTSTLVNFITHITFRAAAQMLESGGTHTTLPGEFGPVDVLRKPLGPAACIAPWNAPAPLAAHKVANAIAAGCPAILKPSEYAPYSAIFLAQAAAAVGLPAGVLQLVHGGGDVGAKLVSDGRIRCVSFTGGLTGGRAVAQACAHDFKPMQLEMGGNNALIVLEDAHLEQTAAGIVAGLTTLNGQWCRALGRLLVHESVQNELLEITMDRLAQVKIGDSMSPESQMGPLIHGRHKQLMETAVAHYQQLGGQIHQSTPLPNLPGQFFPPTLITGVAPEATLEETFGPVATVHPFRSDAEAIQLANQVPYGLGGYVFSQDEEHARRIGRQLETGDVKINGVGLIGLHPMAPRPAWKLSGFGQEGTAETFYFFTGTSVVGIAHRENVMRENVMRDA
jgi:phenylacetaldehyde dehydrogenase